MWGKVKRRVGRGCSSDGPHKALKESTSQREGHTSRRRASVRSPPSPSFVQKSRQGRFVKFQICRRQSLSVAVKESHWVVKTACLLENYRHPAPNTHTHTHTNTNIIIFYSSKIGLPWWRSG